MVNLSGKTFSGFWLSKQSSQMWQWVPYFVILFNSKPEVTCQQLVISLGVQSFSLFPRRKGHLKRESWLEVGDLPVPLCWLNSKWILSPWPTLKRIADNLSRLLNLMPSFLLFSSLFFFNNYLNQTTYS